MSELCFFNSNKFQVLRLALKSVVDNILLQRVPTVHKDTVLHGAMATVVGRMVPASIVSISVLKLL